MFIAALVVNIDALFTAGVVANCALTLLLFVIVVLVHVQAVLLAGVGVPAAKVILVRVGGV